MLSRGEWEQVISSWRRRSCSGAPLLPFTLEIYIASVVYHTLQISTFYTIVNFLWFGGTGTRVGES